MKLPTIFFLLQSTLVRSASTPGCPLPAHPENGKWTVLGPESESHQPGNVVKPSTTLHVTCNKSYKLLGTQLGICGRDGEWEWQTRMGHCSKLCPPWKNSNQVTVSCTSLDNDTGDFVRIKCSEATYGAIAQFECAQYYTVVVDNSTLDYKSSGSGLSKCLNGQWSVKKPNCNPKCGLKSLIGTPLSVNGRNVSEGDYPWQVAVYISSKNTFEFICGASLISEQVVVTAAHCVTSDEGKLMNVRNFALGAGKFYRKFRDSRDPDSQFIRVSHMFIPKSYKAYKQNFLGDIAIVIPKVPFKLTYKIQPICVDWNKKFKNKFFQPFNKGFVSGWGAVNEQGDEPDVLREIEVPFVDNEECSKAISESDDSFITNDKICLGYVNQSKGVCAGDSGGPLVFKNNFDDRFYLAGVVSISPDREIGTSCNSQLYALYTEVYAYLDFVREKAAEFQTIEIDEPSAEPADDDTIFFAQDCYVPGPVENGTAEIRDGRNASYSYRVSYSNFRVEPGVVMYTVCDEGFELVGPTLNLCEGHSGRTWAKPLAFCRGLCPKINPSESSHQVYYKDGKSIIGDHFKNATTVRYVCDKGRSSYGICKTGEWNPIPTCVTDCGSILNGRTDQFPWLARIYSRKVKNMFLCGGTIVNKRAIITAAHCIADHDGRVKPPEEFEVSIGEVSEPYIRISSITKAERYLGIAGNYMGDIAVIVTAEPIRFTKDVAPICLDWMFNREEHSIERGVVSGWGGGTGDGLKRKVLRLPFESPKECRRKIPKEYDKLLTADKTCLGRPSNGSENICKGDGGSGVFVKNPSDNRYYLLGVVSIALGLDCGGLTGVTNISSYMNTAIFEAVLWNAPSFYSTQKIVQEL